MATPQQFTEGIGPAVDTAVNYLIGVVALLGIFVVLAAIWIYFSYNVKVMRREMTKDNRTTVRIIRAKKVKDKSLGHPMIKMFFGKTIPQPPAECIYPYKSSLGNTTLYDFVVKDGVYFPISNCIRGRKYIINPGEGKEPNDEKLEEWAKENGCTIVNTENARIIHSLEGSGLEVTRDFDSEQATLNDLKAAAEKYKTKKPGEVYMLYGLVILAIVGAFITVVYSLYSAGQVTDAVNQGWDLFREWTTIAEQDRIGPG